MLLISVLIGPHLQDIEPGLGAWAYVVGVAFAVVLYFSVLLHEVAHAVAARAFRIPVSSINLHFLGGATEIEGESKRPIEEFVIAIVGPLTSLAIGGLTYAPLPLVHDGLARFVLGALAATNLIVGVLNLVPGLPLDGGRVLQSVVWAITRKRNLGLVIASWGGRVAAAFALGYPLLLAWLGYQPQIIDFVMGFLIASFLWSGATQGLLLAQMRERLPGIQARTLARPALGVPADLPLSEAIRRAQEANAGSLLIVSSQGEAQAVVNEAAVISTPVERRPWVSAGALARTLESGLMLPADLQGEALLEAMQHTPASEYVLLEPSGSVYGVLVSRDVEAAFRTA